MYTLKNSVIRAEKQIINWEKVFAKMHLIKDHYQKYSKNPYNSAIRKQTITLKNGEKQVRHLTKVCGKDA